jgi:Neuraminidase (sialidase)
LRRSTDNGATWKPVKNLSNNAGDSNTPEIAVSGPNVLVTWSDKSNGNYEIFLRRSVDNGAIFQPLVQISNNAGDSLDPQVTTVGPNVYIAWDDTTPGKYDIFLRRSADNGATWSAVKNLSSNPGYSFLVPVG